MKALGLYASAREPALSTWFVAAATLVVRFGFGALLLGTLSRTRPTAREWQQGLAIGVFATFGMLFQMDALSYTAASTSAFLTQGYILILPVVGAIAKRALPERRIVVCVLMVALGLALLARFDSQHLRLGRGEGETLLAAACFSLQILALDHPNFQANRTSVVTVLMFGCIAVALLPVALLTAHGASDFGLLVGSPVAIGLLLLLTIPSTVLAFSLMNRFQPDLSASEAGILYCTEPVFASVLALFLPRFLSSAAHIVYENEHLTARLLIGGGLIISATVLLQLSSKPRAESAV